MTTRKITSCSKVTRSAQQRWLNKGTASRTLPFWLSAESRSGYSTLMEPLLQTEASSPLEGSLWSHHTLFRINSTKPLNSQSSSSLSHSMARTSFVCSSKWFWVFFLPTLCSFIRDDKQWQKLLSLEQLSTSAVNDVVWTPKRHDAITDIQIKHDSFENSASQTWQSNQTSSLARDLGRTSDNSDLLEKLHVGSLHFLRKS